MTDITTMYAAARPESGALKRIRLLSYPFEFLFGILAVLQALAMISLIGAGAFYSGPYLRINPEGVWLLFDLADAPRDSIAIGSLPLVTLLAGAGAIIIIFGAAGMAYYNLSKLFSFYRRGIVFANQTVAMMRKCGFWLIFAALAPGLTQPLMRLVESPDRNWFHGHSLAQLIGGAALFVLAGVIALGREIERDQKGFI